MSKIRPITENYPGPANPDDMPPPPRSGSGVLPARSLRSRPFKQSDIKPCSCCGKGLMSGGLPLFYRVVVDRLGINLSAVRRQAGLEMLLNGSAAIAAAMGPDEDMATVLMEPRELLVCEACTHEHPILMRVFLEPAS